MTDHNGVAGDEARFVQLIAMFQLAAMQQMGKLTNPATGEVERDLPAARASIDMLETIERRSQGNRTPAEGEFMEKVLFELRMNYVDETRRASEEPDEGAGGGDGGEDGDKERDGGAPGDPGDGSEP